MKTRIITAIIGLIIVLPIIIYGSFPFILVSFLLALVGLFELIRMYNPKETNIYLLFSILFIILLIFFVESINIGSFFFNKSVILLFFCFLFFSILFIIALIFPVESIKIVALFLNKTDILLVFGLFLLSLTVFTKNKFTFNDAGFLLISVMYIGLSFNYLIDIRLAGLNYLL